MSDERQGSFRRRLEALVRCAELVDKDTGRGGRMQFLELHKMIYVDLLHVGVPCCHY